MKLWEKIWDEVRLLDSGENAAAIDAAALVGAAAASFFLIDIAWGAIDPSSIRLLAGTPGQALASAVILAACAARIRNAGRHGRLDR